MTVYQFFKKFVFYIFGTVNNISVIHVYVKAKRCAGGLKKNVHLPTDSHAIDIKQSSLSCSLEQWHWTIFCGSSNGPDFSYIAQWDSLKHHFIFLIWHLQVNGIVGCPRMLALCLLFIRKCNMTIKKNHQKLRLHYYGPNKHGQFEFTCYPDSYSGSWSDMSIDNFA